MYAHKKARHVAEYVPGLETQNFVPNRGTIKSKTEIVLESWEPVFTIINQSHVT